MPPTPHREQPPLLWGLPPILPEGRMQALVLGSFPSVASLESKQYYAHPQNWFWRVLEHCGVIESAAAPYAERVRRLRRIGLGVWDLYGQVRREGSGDDRIHDAIANRIDLLHERERPLPHPAQRPPPARMESPLQRDRGRAHPHSHQQAPAPSTGTPPNPAPPPWRNGAPRLGAQSTNRRSAALSRENGSVGTPLSRRGIAWRCIEALRYGT